MKRLAPFHSRTLRRSGLASNVVSVVCKIAHMDAQRSLAARRNAGVAVCTRRRSFSRWRNASCCARPVPPASGGALAHGGGISNCPTTPGVRVVPEQKLRFSVHPGRHPSFCKLRPCKTVEFRRNRLEHWNCGAFCLAQPLRTITSLRDDLCSMSAAGDGPSAPDAPLLHPMAVANDPLLTKCQRSTPLLQK